MKTLLVKPYNLSDHVQPSLGLGYLAASVRSRHTVRILDCIKEGANIDKFAAFIKAYRPDVVGLQCYTFDLHFIKDALSMIKTIDRGIITVIGGPHPSAMPVETMGALGDRLDFLFAGEAELGFADLLDSLERGTAELHDVPNLVWRDGGKIRSNQRSTVEDLDILGMPAWDLIHPEEYPESQHGAFFKKFPIAPIMITRGCPYPCTFCAGGIVSGKKVRHRSIDNVLKEITCLNLDFGIKEFHIIDDNFTFDREYAKEFLRRLKAMRLDISLAVPNGVRMDTLDEEMLVLMKQAGLYLISLGIESGSDRVLRAMKKSINVLKIRECVKMINDSGIDIAGFFILGFPGETVETIMETIRFSLSLKLVRANYFTYLPFPGSESYAQLRSAGRLKDVDWDEFFFFNAAYVPDGMTRVQLRRLHRAAFARFYLRPRIILYNIRSIKNFRHFMFLVKRFLNWIVFN